MRFETEVPSNIYVEATADDRFYLKGKNGIDTWKIGMTREQAVKTARALMKMTGEEEKAIMEEPTNNRPPLGAAPYYIHAENRIKELGLAIARNAHMARMNTQRYKVIEWAREITLQIAIIETLEQPTITPEEMERIQEALKKGTAEIMTEEEWMKKNGYRYAPEPREEE